MYKISSQFIQNLKFDISVCAVAHLVIEIQEYDL